MWPMLLGSPSELAKVGSLSDASFSFQTVASTGVCSNCGDRSRQVVVWNGVDLSNADHYITVEEDRDGSGYVSVVVKADNVGPVGYGGSFGQTGSSCADSIGANDGGITATLTPEQEDAGGTTHTFKYRVKLFWKTDDTLLSTVETSLDTSGARDACIE